MASDEPETVVITLIEYQDLKDSANFLQALEDVGVDNWSGYSDAQEQYHD